MGAVAAGAILVAVLLAIMAAMVWQEARRAPADLEVVYVPEEATAFVYRRLSDRALARLDADDVASILDLGVRYHQTAPAGNGDRPIIGSGDAIEYIMEHARAEHGRRYEPIDIAEVLAVEAHYLQEIGAIGEPVAETETEEEAT